MCTPACNEIYTEETRSVLGVRLEEHLAGKKRGILTSPLDKHRMKGHSGADFVVKYPTLAYEISSSKTFEAFRIIVRNPTAEMSVLHH